MKTFRNQVKYPKNLLLPMLPLGTPYFINVLDIVKNEN